MGNGQSGQELVNADNTISGAGTLGDGSLSIQNSGLVDANGTNALIIVGGSSGGGTASSTFRNSGTLEAGGSGGLVIEGAVLNTQGTIQALTGSHVDLANGALIAGGTIVTAAGTPGSPVGGGGPVVAPVPGGIIDTIAGSATLGVNGQNVALNNAGQLLVNDDTTLTLAASTVNNSGTVALEAAGHATDLVLGGGSVIEFQGGGTVTLSDDSHNAIAGNGQSGEELVNVDNTISGAGTLGDGVLSIQNNAVIDATGTNALTIIAGSGGTGGAIFQNFGMLEGSGSGGLIVQGNVINASQIEANAGGTVSVTGDVQGFTGSLALGANATLDLGGADAETITFQGAGATLRLHQAQNVGGQIAGLVVGDIIDFAKATVTNATIAGSTLTVSESGGPTLTFQVAGALTGNFFKLQSDGAGGTDLVLSPATISAAGVTLTATEGALFTATVATFTDANPNVVAGDFTATILWGDGTFSTGTVSANASGGFNVAGTHIYTEEGKDAIGVNITDGVGNSAVAASTAAVGDATLAAGAVNVTATEGTLANATVATFTDANLKAPVGDFTATITWGDGATSTGTVVSNGGGSFSVTGTHTYADEGTDNISVAIADKGGSTASATSTATVADADALAGQGVSLHTEPHVTLSNVVVANFTDALAGNVAGDLVASDLTATINWGDGATTIGTVSGGNGVFAVSGTHSYATPGLETVKVTLADDAPGAATAVATGTIDVILPTVTLNPINGNNSIDNDSAEGDRQPPAPAAIVLSGAVTGMAPKSTFQVTVTDGSFANTYVATVNAAGTGWTATVPGADVARLPNGTATFTAEVTDAFGATSLPAVQLVTVEGTTPIVLAVAALPATGALGVGQTVAITLTMNESVTVLGNPQLDLNDGGSALFDAPRSTATSLVFDYTVRRGQNTADLKITGIENSDNETIRSLGGDKADLSGALVDLGLTIDTGRLSSHSAQAATTRATTQPTTLAMIPDTALLTSFMAAFAPGTFAMSGGFATDSAPIVFAATGPSGPAPILTSPASSQH